MWADVANLFSIKTCDKFYFNIFGVKIAYERFFTVDIVTLSYRDMLGRCKGISENGKSKQKLYFLIFLLNKLKPSVLFCKLDQIKFIILPKKRIS